MEKISIITVCYNSAETIEDTIKSVINQDYPNIEYIIIDGLSKDNTLEIVNRYKESIAQIISEKDKGIYDAINKGVSRATGEVVAILNSDDMYSSSGVISSVMKMFSDSGADAVYGDLHYVDRFQTDKVVRYWKSGKYHPGRFLNGWMPPHPSFFVRNKCYQQYGLFHTHFKTSADYELMLRFIHKHKISVAYLPSVLVKMRIGGQSNVSLKNRIEANREDRKAWEINGLKPGLFTLIKKPLSKIVQFLG
jgi:glycosyltransferase involved in cell wall biosynthesis